MKKKKLVNKIFISVVVVLLISGAISFSLVYLLFPRQYVRVKKEKINRQMEELIWECHDKDFYELKAKLYTFSYANFVNVAVNDDLGARLYAVNLEDAYLNSENNMYEYRDKKKKEREYKELSYEMAIDNRAYIIRVFVPIETMPLEAVGNVAQILLSVYPFAMIISIIFSILLSLFAAKFISKPIVAITDKITKMSLFEYKPHRREEEKNICNEIEILDIKLDNLYYSLNESNKNLKIEIKEKEKQEQLKYDFLRMAAHELKTPLTTINGMLEGMYLKVPPYDNTSVYLMECQKIVGKMNCLIQDMLLSTKEEGSGEKTSFGVKSMVEQVMDIFTVDILQKELDVSICISNDIIVFTSRDLLESALKNIVRNAVLYTDRKGKIKVFVNQGKLIVFNECDIVEKEQIERLFEAFYRGNHLDIQGNGLGLYLVKRVLDLLELDFAFQSSKEGDGMEFHINIREIWSEA